MLSSCRPLVALLCLQILRGQQHREGLLQVLLHLLLAEVEVEELLQFLLHLLLPEVEVEVKGEVAEGDMLLMLMLLMMLLMMLWTHSNKALENIRG